MAFNKEDIIKYRIEKARSCYKEVDVCLEKNLLHLAENRIYYSLFYSASALAMLKGFVTSKHKQLQSWFNREFIKTGIFPVRSSICLDFSQVESRIRIEVRLSESFKNLSLYNKTFRRK